MKAPFLRILLLLSLIVGLSLVGNAARGFDDDDADEIKFTGIIESLPNTPGFIGDWRVSGRTVHVTAATELEREDGPIVPGARVKVEGKPRADGSIDAEEIEVEDDDDDDENEIEFKGTIEMLPGTPGFIGDWRVGGRIIHVSPSTRIEAEHGPVAVGAFVEVEGTLRPDGSMDASEIEVKSNVAGGDGRDELKGTIESLPNTPSFIGDWRVAGRTVHVTSATFIDQEHGPPAVGAFVEVKGNRRLDGSIDATKIEVEGGREGEGRGKIKGIIQSLPDTPSLMGDWMVSGRLVHVTSSTRLKNQHGVFAVGTPVKVKGITLSDGSIVATKIQVRN